MGMLCALPCLSPVRRCRTKSVIKPSGRLVDGASPTWVVFIASCSESKFRFHQYRSMFGDGAKVIWQFRTSFVKESEFRFSFERVTISPERGRS